MSDVTRILSQIESGDPSAAEELLPLVYQELRKLAAAKLTKEKPGQSLQPTLLVHEAYLRLVDGDQHRWSGRGHFFAAAAEAMRRILVENARRKQSRKHGGQLQRVELSSTTAAAIQKPDEDLLALDEALTRLEELWPDKAKLVKLKYFAGLTIPEAAEAMGISPATAERYWRIARAWLHLQLKNGN